MLGRCIAHSTSSQVVKQASGIAHARGINGAILFTTGKCGLLAAALGWGVCNWSLSSVGQVIDLEWGTSVYCMFCARCVCCHSCIFVAWFLQVTCLISFALHVGKGLLLSMHISFVDGCNLVAALQGFLPFCLI